MYISKCHGEYVILNERFPNLNLTVRYIIFKIMRTIVYTIYTGPHLLRELKLFKQIN